jgi:hypothetical protein
VLTYFVVCGVSRLARFNVTAATLTDTDTGKVKYFEGTPIPTSIVIVALLGTALWLGRIDDDLGFGAYRIGPALLHHCKDLSLFRPETDPRHIRDVVNGIIGKHKKAGFVSDSQPTYLTSQDNRARGRFRPRAQHGC